MGRRTWIKIYTDKWLCGTLREETAELRGIWTDILSLAGDSTYGDEGYIKLAENVGYTDEQIIAILHLTNQRKWSEIKKRLEETDRIKILEGNIIKIINWPKYQFEYKRQKSYRPQSYSTKLLQKLLGETRREKREEREEREERKRVVQKMSNCTPRKSYAVCISRILLKKKNSSISIQKTKKLDQISFLGQQKSIKTGFLP